MLSDIVIAQAAKMLPIAKVAEKLGLTDEDLIPYGRYKAKINHKLIHSDRPDGKLILMTAISPTPAGEGKTTTSVGLADALNAMGKKTMLCLREPSLGPVFGVKGGAAGGGYAQVVPMEDINLHFTGDIHAIGTANNLLAAMIDNSIQQGNPLNIDPRRIAWKRCMDMNDRQLRFIVDGLGGKVNGTPREDGFDITVASEVMAIFCLATDLADLKDRLSRIVCAYTYDGQPVTAGQIGAAGAMAALLKDAIDPNLVQTLENNPAIIHGGPFANIAHGCNSVTATKLSLKLADYVVTEAGFGADLGAEKFVDIKCRMADLHPSAVVLVATVRALKSHGGVAKPQAPVLVSLLNAYYTQRRAGAYSQKGKVSNLKEMNETFNYLRANGIYSLEDLEHRVSEHSAATESLKKTLDEQTARMKAIKQLYDSSAAFQSLKPVYDGLQKIKFEKPRAKYKAEHEAELKQFYAARRKLTGEFPDGKVDMKKLTEEYDELEQAHNTTYGEFKTVRDDLHRLWKVKSCVDTAARFNERTEEQKLQNRPQTRQKKEELSR